MENSSAAPIVLIAILGLVGLAIFGLWLWSLLHCIQNKFLTDTNRIIGIAITGSVVDLFLPRESTPQR